MRKKRSKRNPSSDGWKRFLLIVACFILIAIRWVWPSLQVDSTTLWLVGIAAVLLVLPDLKSMVPFIKRIRVGDAEVELKESIATLGKEVEKAQIAVEARGRQVDRGKFSADLNEVDNVIAEAGRDPRAALLLLSSKIEKQIRDRVEGDGTQAARLPTAKLVEAGVTKGVFPEELAPAVRDFWAVRNQVAHGKAFDVDDKYLYSIISLGKEIYEASS